MSFREKSAWISFITILLVFGAYFWNVARIAGGNVGGHAGFVISISLIGAFILLEIVLHITVMLQSPKEAQAPKDERERLIELKATNVAFLVLMVGAMLLLGIYRVVRSRQT